MNLVAYLLFAVPFVFGLLRLVTSGDDWRYVVVALASSIGALVALMGLRRTSASPMARALGTVAAAAVLAAATAALLGARSGVAIAMVAIGFAVCSAGGTLLYGRSRGTRSP